MFYLYKFNRFIEYFIIKYLRKLKKEERNEDFYKRILFNLNKGDKYC